MNIPNILPCTSPGSAEKISCQHCHAIGLGTTVAATSCICQLSCNEVGATRGWSKLSAVGTPAVRPFRRPLGRGVAAALNRGCAWGFATVAFACATLDEANRTTLTLNVNVCSRFLLERPERTRAALHDRDLHISQSSRRPAQQTPVLRPIYSQPKSRAKVDLEGAQLGDGTDIVACHCLRIVTASDHGVKGR